MATYIFGSKGPVQPAQPTYAEYINLEDDLELTWASSFVDTNTPVATTMLFSASVTGLRVLLPDAKQAGVGTSFRAINNGERIIEICDFAGHPIFTLIPSTDESDIYQNVVDVTLQNDSTSAGHWLVVNVGGTTSSASANALAGYGLTSLPVSASTNTLDVNLPMSLRDTSFALSASDRASVLYCTSDLTIALPDLYPIANGFFCYIYAAASTVTLQCADATRINAGAANGSLILSGGQSCMLEWGGQDDENDGVYTTIGLQTFPGAEVTFVTIDMTGQPGGLDLSADALNRTVIIFTGTLSQNTTVYFGTDGGQWTVHNTIASGNFTITLRGGSIATPGSSSYVLRSLQCFQVYYNATSADLYVVDPFYNGQAPYVGQPIISTVSGPAYSGLSMSQYLGTTNVGPVTAPANTPLTALQTIQMTPLIQERFIVSGVVYATVGVDVAQVVLTRVASAGYPDPTNATIEVNLGTISSADTTLRAIPIYYLDVIWPDPTPSPYTVQYTVTIVPSATGVPYLNRTPAIAVPDPEATSIIAITGIRGPL